MRGRERGGRAAGRDGRSAARLRGGAPRLPGALLPLYPVGALLGKMDVISDPP